MKRLLLVLLLSSACAVAPPVPTDAPRATDTPAPTATATSTATPTPMLMPTDTSTPTPTFTPTPTENTVVINPGDNIQAKINAAPLGTTFVFSTAVYERVSIRPRTGDIYIGQDSILDGMGVTYKAFSAIDQPNDPDRPMNVTISGFEIRNYISHTSAESNLSPEGAIDGAEGWFIGGNYIHHNKAGISLGKGNWGWGDGSIIQNNTITDNGEIGVEINGSNILFEGNELARNGYSLSNKAADWMGAASKFTDQPVWSDSTFSSFTRRTRFDTDQLVIRSNYSHRNNGMGLWLDVFNRNALIEENTVELNRSSGIFDELSTGTTIRNNVVRFNRLNNTNTGLWGGAEIFAANSEGGIVAGNIITVSGNGRGIILVDESYRTPRMNDYRVLSNSITYTAKPVYGANIYSPVAGMTGGGGNQPFQTANNLFDGNTYILPFGSTSLDLFWYWDSGLSWGGFRSKGHEANGSVQVSQ